jgi:hypothetical protein
MSKLAGFTVAIALSVTVLAGAGAASSAAPRPHGSRVRFLSHVVRLLVANRYADAWESLNPADQKLAPEPVYVACESLSPVPGHLVSLRTVACATIESASPSVSVSGSRKTASRKQRPSSSPPTQS